MTRSMAILATAVGLVALLSGPAGSQELIFADGFGSGDLWGWDFMAGGSPAVGPCPCEVVTESLRSQQTYSSTGKDVAGQIVALLSRRPCTVAGIASGLGLRPNEVIKHLEELRVAGAIEPLPSEGKHYYRAIRNE